MSETVEVEQDTVEMPMVAIEGLITPDYNANEVKAKTKGDLKQSINQFGFVEPIIVNTYKGRENIVVGGNHRVMMAKELGMKEVPVVYVNLNEKLEKELNLRLNKNRGELNAEKLKEMEEDILLKSGFTPKEIGDITDKAEADLKKAMEEGVDLEIPKMESQPYEQYDYIVLMFKDTHDWMHALQKLGIRDVDYSLIENKKIGLGRVVDGAKFVSQLKD